MDADDQRVRVHVSPLAYLAGIVAGVLLLTMIGLLIAQLAVLKDSREHIVAQDRKITALQEEVRPLLRETGPAVREAQPLLRQVRRLLGPAGRSLESLTTAAGTIPRLAAGLNLLVGDTIPLVRALNASGAPAAIAAVGRLADALAANGRIVRLVDSANRTLAELEREDLILRTSQALPRLEERFRRLLRLQSRTLRVQMRSVRIQARQERIALSSLAIQQETLERIRSIDRKTGPAPPATPITP
jgi:hypothetical protein